MIDSVRERFGEAKLQFSRARLRLGLVAAESLAVVFGAEWVRVRFDHLRDSFAEPYDVVDHLGNVGISTLAGSTVGIMAVGLASERYLNNDGIFDRSKATKLATCAALGAGMLINTLAETKWGLNLLPMDLNRSTGTADFGYGIVAATGHGALGGMAIGSLIQADQARRNFRATGV